MSIHHLPPDVAAKIAAGEVVERPANVVKELIENSLDAGATEIRVEIREGGQRLLRVSDNGHGIPGAEVPLAFARHATSKLAGAEDLNHIATFGFRGEALYSIAAVSHVDLTTHHQDEAFGAQIRLEGGNQVSQGRAGAPVGTIISVEHLFYNVPARKKFLRKPATETGHINAVVQRYALAHPERRLSLVNEGRLVFQSTGTGNLFDVLVKVYGLDNARQMTGIGLNAGMAANATPDKGRPAEHEQGARDEVDFMPASISTSENSTSADSTAVDSTAASFAASDRPPDHGTGTQQGVLVAGYTSSPALTRANRNNIDLFVNRRYIEDRTLTHAVVQAYHTLLPVGRYPIAVIFIEIDPSQVDVNVHPQKTRVRFHEERRLFSAVQKAVRNAILRHAPIPDMQADAGQSYADTGWEVESRQSGWASRRASLLNPEQPQTEMDFYIPQPAPAQNSQDAPNAIWRLSSQPAESGQEAQEQNNEPAQSDSGHDEAEEQGSRESRSSMLDRPAPPDATHKVDVQSGRRQLPPLRVVGQVGTLYIIAEGPEGLYLIDQHAAHERILYEQYMAQRYDQQHDQQQPGSPADDDSRAGGVAQQQLLEPLTLHVGHEVTGRVVDYLDELQAVGFGIEPFGGDTFLVRAIPAVLSGQDPLRMLEEIVDSLTQQRNQVGEEVENRLVKIICKRAAIKAGQQLSPLEMQELVRQLEECQSPRTCPHGRPTMIQLSAGELEKAFGRI